MNPQTLNWSEYETLVYEECIRVFGESTQRNIHIKGQYSKRQRQIDVFVPHATIEGKDVSIILDAKHYNKKVDIKKVESFISMVKDVNVSHGIIVSSKGFTKAAINRAHNSPDSVEVDILSLEDFATFESIGGLPYSGKFGFAVQSPFCWVLNGERKYPFLASFYPRGCWPQANVSESEFMYLKITPKSDTIKSTTDLLKYQESIIIKELIDCRIETEISEGIILRYLRCRNYKNIEIAGFREFEKCFLYVVLFCPDNMIKKDIVKLKFILNSAIPVNFRS